MNDHAGAHHLYLRWNCQHPSISKGECFLHFLSNFFLGAKEAFIYPERYSAWKTWWH